MKKILTAKISGKKKILYKANVICLKNKNGDLWVIMNYVKDGLGVKSMSDLVLKEIYGAYGKKN